MAVKKIEEGDLSIRLNKYSKLEFSQISDGINYMVENISQSMQANEKLMEEQNKDIERKSAEAAKLMELMELREKI